MLVRILKKDDIIREVAIREGSGTFMSNTNYQGIEN
jgi:hypothetical protein